MVDKAFLKFDANGSGTIEAADLKGIYNASFHPKVISGEMTEDEVFLEFLANFGDRNGDGRIDRAEWNDYYAAVSSSIDNDDHFVQLMQSAWKLWIEEWEKLRYTTELPHIRDPDLQWNPLTLTYDIISEIVQPIYLSISVYSIYNP